MKILEGFNPKVMLTLFFRGGEMMNHCSIKCGTSLEMSDLVYFESDDFLVWVGDLTTK